MHYHQYYQDQFTEKSGVWEVNGKIVAIVYNELWEGEAFFTVEPDYVYLKPAMLEHAEVYLSTIKDGTKTLRVFGNDFDQDLNHLLQTRGYKKKEGYIEYHTVSLFDMEKPFPNIVLPEGFTLKSLEEDNDLMKVDRVIWRGFNHEGEPPESGIAEKKLMQSAPNEKISPL